MGKLSPQVTDEGVPVPFSALASSYLIPSVSPKTQRKTACDILASGFGIRRRPILPGRHQPGTFGAEKLNFCVRDGNRWDLLAIITGNFEYFSYPQNLILDCSSQSQDLLNIRFLRSSPRPISIDNLTHHCVYSVNLSTLSSSRGLTGLCHGILFLMGGFTLRCFQRLSRPHFASLLCRWHDNSCTRGASTPVLSY